MRLFAAVVPPPPVLDSVAAALADAGGGHTRARWTRRPQWHITLAFYGEVRDPDRRGDLQARLARSVARRQPANVQLARAGVFTGRSGDVLWLGLRHAGTEGPPDTGTPLGRLAEGASAAGRRAGVPVEGRRFRPHLTLARGVDRETSRAVQLSLLGFRSPAWMVDEVVLLRSVLPAGGGPGARPGYQPLACYPVRAPRA